jgi:uncharacterized protein YfdQ (DUF2303 family)
MTEKTHTSVAADSIVSDVRNLVEHYAAPTVIDIKEPETEIVARAVLANGGLTPLPSGLFEPFRPHPRFRQGSSTLLSLDSLIDHVNRFKDDGSAVFANDDRNSPSITAVLDYHPKGGATEISTGELTPRFGKHRSLFTFPVSDEWKAWNAANGAQNAMTMADFAAFLEDRIIDVLYMIPGEDTLSEDLQRLVDTLGGGDTIATPNKLIQLARGLQINEAAVVQEAVNLQSGEGVIRFQSEHTDEHGGPLKVPALFLIGIPVFRNGPLYRLAARLRYRKKGPSIIFWYELWRTDRTFDAAFNEAVERVKVETELPVFIGKPEA